MDNVRSQRELGLLPEGADQWGALWAASLLSAGFLAQVRHVLRIKVRQGKALEMTPDVFGGVKFGRMRWQSRQGDQAARTRHIVALLPAAICGLAGC